jgi:hypothetical protein
MNPTDQEASAKLAGAMFDEVLAPIAKARKSSGKPAFFALEGEESVKSYFVPAPLRVMAPADFELRIGDKAEELIDDLCAYWTKQGDPELVAMGARLKQVAGALSGEAAENHGRVDILCYTLF